MVHYHALHAHERKLYDEAVRRTHWRRVEAVILTKNGDSVRSLTNKFLGGNINGDQSRTPAELLEAHILDVDQLLDYAHGRHRKYDIQIVDHRFVPTLGDREVVSTETNYTTNPSLETNGTTWAASAGWTGQRLAAADAFDGGWLFRTTVTALPTTVTNWMLQGHNSVGNRIPANVGQKVGVRVRARTKPGIGPRTVESRLRAYNAGVAGPIAGFGVTTTVVTEEWTELAVSGDLPAAMTEFVLLHGPKVVGEWAIGDYIEFDARQVWKGAGNDPGPRSFWHGDTADRDLIEYAWTGAAHASTSTKVVTRPRGEWVEQEAFTGPMWEYDRVGDEVTIIAQGAERKAMGSIRKVRFWPRKSRGTDVVTQLLAAAGALRRDLHIPRLKAKLPRSVTVGVRVGHRRDTNGKKEGKGKDNRPKTQRMNVGRGDTYWGKAAPIADALHRDLFPNGRGEYVMDPPQDRPVASLTAAQLLSEVKENPGDDSEQTNTWIILGADPKGPKPRVRAEVGLPKKHPLSAHEQRWNGEPYEVTETIENRHLRRKKDAVKLGLQRRSRAMSDLTTYEIEAIPVLAWLRPGAAVTAPLNTRRVKARARTWTLPLGPEAEPLVIGGNRRSSF